MPSIGEQGWGDLVSNNFNVIDNAIGNGTRILMIPIPNQTITTSNFSNYASYGSNNVYIAQFGGENVTIESIPKPPKSCRLMIISVGGNLTINGSIDTYPTTLQSETPPNSETTNTYANNISFVEYYVHKIILEYIANENNSILNMNQEDYLNFINNTMLYTPIFTTIQYSLSIPHAIAAGGSGIGGNGTSGTAINTCNGGGGGGSYGGGDNTGGTGCIFGQYAGGSYGNGYGYGSSVSKKYRCALMFIVNGNLTINSTITQIGGDGVNYYNGGYGGGGGNGGGGGAPVFIYYTGTYTNNGTINTAGGSGFSNSNYSGGGDGGAGGIKVTKISLQ